MYAAGSLQSTRKKRAGLGPLQFHRLLLSVRLYRSVDDAHPVAPVPGWERGLRERAPAAVVVADDSLVLLVLLHFLFDLVPAEGAAERAEDGGDVLAPAAADLVAEHAAYDRAAHRADSRSLTGFFDRAHFLDDAALAADLGDAGGWRRGRSGCHGNLRFTVPRLGLRYGLLRVTLDRLRRLGLGFGLLWRLCDSGAGIALSRRGR